MTLCILMEEPLSFVRFDKPVGQSFVVGAKVFQQRPIPDDEIVFYDWLADKDGSLCGIEIHVRHDDVLLKSRQRIEELSSVRIHYYPQIWFGSQRSANELGMEAFGDIHFFASEDENELAVLVGLDKWLAPKQREALILDLTARKLLTVFPVVPPEDSFR
jgi:hypothetical protein